MGLAQQREVLERMSAALQDHYAALDAAFSSNSWMRLWYGFPCASAIFRSWFSNLGERRIAMSCFAMPLEGLPTRRIRFKSSSVASGISEKSIFESGICRTFFLTRLPCADDADGFFFMCHLPCCIDHEENPAYYRLPHTLTSDFPC